ncbi:MAG: acyl carrier protein [Clostridia bacterium]|nr:acyl carrier protein [Clostridia bacterium]
MILDTLKEFIVEQIKVDPNEITLDTKLSKDLEADSLDQVEILMALEDEYNIEIPDEVAERFITVRDIVDYLENHI